MTLSRPEIHNAFNEKMIQSLTTFFESLNDDTDLRLVVLKGEGKSFCAGADLKWMKSMKDYSRDENYLDSLALSRMFEAMDGLKVPLLGFVHGAVLGGGTGVVAACDYVLANEETVFGFTEVKIGLIPAVISPYVMAKIGTSQARAYFLTGERFDEKKALQMGLIHQVSLSRHFHLDSQKCIEKFLATGPKAQIAAKRLIRGVCELQDQGPDKIRDFTCQMISSIRVGQEGQEGMMALLDKRKPSWMKNNKNNGEA